MGVTGHRAGAERIKLKLKKRRDSLIRDAEDALARAVAAGALATQDNLEAAETRTGITRANKGIGTPGRHASGNMVGSVSHNGDSFHRRGKLKVASFGWFPGEFEAYFKLQDQGSDTPQPWPSRPGLETTIPAAHALDYAFVMAREQLRAELRDLVR